MVRKVLYQDDAEVPTQFYGVSDVQVATRTLTSAEILSMFSDPVLLVPGVAGKTLLPTLLVAVYRHLTTDYVFSGYPALCVAPSAGATVFPLIGVSVTGWLDSYTNGIAATNGVSTSDPILSPMVLTSYSSQAGQGLYIGFDTQEPTGGDGEVDVTVEYRVVDIS